VVVTVCADAEDARERLAGVGLFYAGDELRRALGHDAAAAFATFGAEIDDPIGLLDDVEVVLDDQDSVADRDQPLERSENVCSHWR
jgi:hypothetical protein